MIAEPRNILIIKPSALGDVAMALPALVMLDESFPQAKISWLIRPEYASLLEGNEHLDEVIIFDRKVLGKWWFRPSAFMALVRFIKRLRGGGFGVMAGDDMVGKLAEAGNILTCGKKLKGANADMAGGNPGENRTW